MKKCKDKCIICGSEKIQKNKSWISPFLYERMFDNQQRFTSFIVCKNCQVGYYSLRPTDEEMAKLYLNYRGEEYQIQRQKYEPEYTKELNKELSTNTKQKNCRLDNLISILIKNINVSKIKNILDFGGDKGEFIPDFPAVNKYVYDISGVEPIDGIISITSQNDLKNYTWDLILCSHVLEHVSDPLGLINHLISILKKDSLLYIEIPYENYLISEISFIKKLKEILRRPKVLTDGKYINYIMHEHINFYRPKTLKKIFSGNDFKIIYNEQCKINDICGDVKIISCLVQKK